MNLNEKTYIGDIVQSERPVFASREQVTVASGAGVLKAGTVLGQRTKSSVVAAAAEGNDGNGAVGAATLGAKAEVGVYTLTCIAEETNDGVFQVVAPSGYRLPDLQVGVAYAGDHINLTVADGASDFQAGDVITVTVSGDGKFVPAVFGAVNGAGVGAAILLEDVDTTEADAVGVLALSSDAVVAKHALIYHASADNADKKAALLSGLAAKGIKFMEGA